MPQCRRPVSHVEVLRRGDVEVAQRLSALAQATAKKFGDGRKERIDLVQSTASIVAANQAKFAIECAFSGASRSRLLAIWQAIDKLPATSLTAKTMVRDYRALIAEDGAWNEPEDVDPSTLSEPAQIAYWIDCETPMSFTNSGAFRSIEHARGGGGSASESGRTARRAGAGCDSRSPRTYGRSPTDAQRLQAASRCDSPDPLRRILPASVLPESPAAGSAEAI